MKALQKHQDNIDAIVENHSHDPLSDVIEGLTSLCSYTNPRASDITDTWLEYYTILTKTYTDMSMEETYLIEQSSRLTLLDYLHEDVVAGLDE